MSEFAATPLPVPPPQGGRERCGAVLPDSDESHRVMGLQLSRRRPLQSLRRVEGSGDDALIAGAAAKIARDRDAHLLLGWIGIVAQEFGERDQHSGRAEAALQAVIVAERLLQGIELVGAG